MNKIIIFGLNNLSEMMCYNLEKAGCIVDAYTVDRRYIKQDTFRSKPVIPFEEIESLYYPKDYDFCLCLGYTKMNAVREKIFTDIENKGYNIINYIHPTACVNNAKLGKGNLIFENTILGYNTILGNGNIVYPGAQIAHHTHVGNFNFFAISSSIAGSCKVGTKCFFGNNSSTKNGLTFGDQTLVGAGTYIGVDTEENGVYASSRSYKLDNKSSLYFY